MAKRPQRKVPAELRELQKRLDALRKGGRKRRLRIPEEIWTAAAIQARSHGINRVARTLRLDYYTLKRRAAAAKPGLPPPTQPSAPKFVEIDFAPSPAMSGCTIELEDQSGAKMTMRLAGGGVAELVTLAEAFWRRPG